MKVASSHSLGGVPITYVETMAQLNHIHQLSKPYPTGRGNMAMEVQQEARVQVL